MERKLPKEPFPKKVKASRLVDKVMLTVFWDAEGIILADFIFACRHKHEQRILFRSHKVSKTGNGKEEKKQASKRTCPSPPRQCTATSGRRHHGNNRGMRPPTSWTSTLFPWLSSLRLFLFPEMKRQLKGRRFEDRKEICAVTEEWLLAQPPHFYFEGLFKVKNRWQKCISLDGGWVEK